MDVSGKVAVVAGGASGLGRAVCEDLAGRGMKVAVLDRDGGAAKEVAGALGDAARSLAVDVTDAEEIEAAMAAVVDAFGAVHVNVNTAGIVGAGKIARSGKPLPLATFAEVIDVNLVGTFNVMRCAVAAMLGNEPDDNGERGAIVNTASAAAYDGQAGQAGYSASKAGVIGMALPIARDLAGTGIRINTIAPGLFDTPMAASVPSNVIEGIVEVIQEPRRQGKPSEFAALVHHLIENQYINAECVRIDAATRLNPR